MPDSRYDYAPGKARHPTGFVTRRCFIVAGFLATVLPSAAQASSPARRIVAVGDLHGDFEAYRVIIGAAGLVDGRGRWAAGKTIFVQTGDIADRGPDSRRIVRHLRRLQREADRAGGEVIALVGNHEAMNVIGDLRYVHPGEYLAFVDRHSSQRREQAYEANKESIRAAALARDPNLTDGQIRAAWFRDTPLGKVEHRAAWRPGGEIGSWVARNPAVALIQGNLFAHGGISASYARLSLSEINRRTREALIARATGPGSIIEDPEGPLWYRGHVPADRGRATSGNPAAEIGEILAAHGAQRLIIGHTPLEPRIQILHGGRLIVIDTGNSAAHGGHRSYLEIIDGQAIAHSVGPSQRDNPQSEGTVR